MNPLPASLGERRGAGSVSIDPSTACAVVMGFDWGGTPCGGEMGGGALAIALPPFCARRYALHRLIAAPHTKGRFFVRFPLMATIYRRKNFPPYWPPHGDGAVRFHPRPRVGPFRCPPLRCRGKALAGSGGRYVSRRRVALGVGPPCKRGSVPIGIHQCRFTRPEGRSPCRGAVAVCDVKELAEAGCPPVAAIHCKPRAKLCQCRDVQRLGKLLVSRCLILYRQSMPNRDICVMVKKNLNVVRKATQNFDAETYSVWNTPPNRGRDVVVCFLKFDKYRDVQRLGFWVTCRGVDMTRGKCSTSMQVPCHTSNVVEWLRVQRLGRFLAPPGVVGRCMAKVGTVLAGNAGMTFALAFADLDAAAPRQRARCAATGRFVAWSKVPQLRAPGAPRVVVIASPLVVDAPDTAEAVSVADAPPVVGGGLVRSAVALGASLVSRVAGLVRSAAVAVGRVARAAVVVGALAIADRAPRGGGRIGGDAPPVVVGRGGWTM
mgnify:CR=1 FL=1